MSKFTVNAAVMISVEDVAVNLVRGGESKSDYENYLKDALSSVLNERLTLLDIRGGRSGNDGLITFIDVTEIEDWNAE